MVTVLGAHELIETLDTPPSPSPVVTEVQQAALPIAAADASPTIPASDASATINVSTPADEGSAITANALTATASAAISHDDSGVLAQTDTSAAAADPISATTMPDTTAAQTAHETLTPLAPSELALTDKPQPQATRPAAQPVTVALDKTALLAATRLNALMGTDPTGEFSADPIDLDEEDDGVPDLSDEIAAKETYVPEWQTYTVQPGDTFAVMAERSLGLGYSEVMHLLKVIPDKKVLTNLRVGRNLDYKLDEQGQLLAMKIMEGSRNGYLLERNNAESEFEVSEITRATQATQRLFAGTVEGSFALSAQATGLSGAEVAELTKVLGKKVNFRADTRQGDHFQVLIESDTIDGKPLDSRVLAARYDGARKDITIVRHNEHFYTPDGKGLDTAFERYPFHGHYRISSPFNLKRHHPITGRISPHLGTDFAVPVGTSVYATADGRVTKVGHHPLAGRYIVITHDNGYKTRYLHLSKPLVKKGERVKMDERIALSGNTGRSTGAHLHYEVLVDNRQVDAMRVKLPDGNILSGKELAAFKQKSKRLIAKLDTADDTRAIARVKAKDHDSET